MTGGRLLTRPAHRTASIELPGSKLTHLLVAGVVIAVALWLAIPTTYPGMNASYALLWGDQIADLRAPDYAVPATDTPHPLSNAIGAVVSLAGTEGAEVANAAVNYASLAACVVLVFLVAQAWFGSAAAVLAGVLFITRPSILANGVTSHLDTLYLALVLAALLVEIRRPRNGQSTLSLLVVAGLLRPEAWVLSGLYVLYVARLDRARFLRLAALASLAPLIWFAADLILAGNPLHSFTYTRDFAKELERDTGLVDAITLLPTRLSDTTSKVLLAGGLAGALMAVVLPLRRESRTTVALLVITVVIFIGLAAVGFSIVPRYLLVSATLLVILAAFAMTAWVHVRHRDTKVAAALTVVGIVLAGATASFGPEWIGAASDLRTRVQAQERGRDDLRALVQAGTFDSACGPLAVPSHRHATNIVRWTGRPHRSVKTMTLERPRRGYYVLPGNARLDSLVSAEMGGHRFAAPTGFDVVARNESWVVYGRCTA